MENYFQWASRKNGKMFDITSLNTEQKVLFDQLTAAVAAADAISAMEEIEELVSQVAMATGGDEEEILGAAEEIAEKDRWNDIVDQTMANIPDDTVMDGGWTAAELRQEMKDFEW